MSKRRLGRRVMAIIGGVFVIAAASGTWIWADRAEQRMARETRACTSCHTEVGDHLAAHGDFEC